MKEQFGIKILSSYSGVSEYNIRSWEKRYQLLTPQRTEGGHRLYSEHHLNILNAVKELIKQGHTISHLAQWPVSKLLKAAIGTRPIVQVKQSSSSDINQEHLLGILLALQHFKIELLEHEMLKARKSLPVDDFILKLVIPCMKTIGVLYQEGKISVAQEHLMSSLVRSYLYPLIGRRVKSPPKYIHEHTVILAPEKEWHELGILSICALLNNKGVKCSYLGVNTPFTSLLELVTSIAVSNVFIGISEYSITENVGLPKFLKQLNLLPPHLKIYIGGHSRSSYKSLRLNSSINYIESIEAAAMI